MHILTQDFSLQPLGEAATIKKIDKKLSKKKAKGLTMLEEFLKGCSDAAFAENCVKWLQQCTKLDGDDLAVNERSLNMFCKYLSTECIEYVYRYCYPRWTDRTVSQERLYPGY